MKSEELRENFIRRYALFENGKEMVADLDELVAEVEKRMPTEEPHTCPVCGGNGLVPCGFYSQTSGHWSTTSVTPETCKSCNGTGVVWNEFRSRMKGGKG